MKKLSRCLLTIALSAPLLSGCSLLSMFSDLPEETKDVDRLDLRGDYDTSVALNQKYTFNGKVYVVYKDGSEDKEVTSYCAFRDVDTSKVGQSELRVDYETQSKIYYTKTSINVYDPSDKGELQSISVSNYTDTVEKGASYTFDGEVKATYKKVSGEISVDVKDCTIGSISTTSVGTKTLSIGFTDKYLDESGNEHSVTKTTTVNIHVIQKPTAISASDIEVGLNKTARITYTLSPSDTTEKGVSFESANPSVASVDEYGNVKGLIQGQSTKVTISSTASPSVTKTINVNVVETKDESWTVLIYMCGADLESDYASSNEGAATEDLKEIAQVSGQPDNVNVVVQAGGASKWSSTYSSVISKDKRNRFHLENKKYVSDSQTSKVNMGDPDSLQDFIEWGLQTYPADNVGLILWNHGGAMEGACFDEQFSGDGLTPAEMNSAIKAARTTLGYSNLFEFIGYDCCLMQIQDIAGLNSEYAKYQIASEESEWGYGWTYDEWVDDLFAKKSTENILKAIVDSFKSETSSQYTSSQNDQTLSYLDLSKWGAYEDAWEDMASTLGTIITSTSKWSTFESMLETCQQFGYDNQYNYDYVFDVYDVGSFLSKIKTNNNYKSNSTLMSKVDSVSAAYNNLVSYEWHGAASSGATGLSLFAPTGWTKKSDYSTSSTPFTVWRNLCINYGNWY